jgi:hypothetical protein
MTVFQAIVELSKASWRVLRQHPSLAWFPILALIASLGLILFVAPILFGDEEPTWFALLVLLFVVHLAHVFFTVALTGEALRALRGERPSIPDGIATAMSRPAAIFGLAALTSSAGFVLSVLGRSGNAFLRVVRTLLGTAWSLASYLAIPVLVQERRGGLASLRRSGDLFKRTWGETALSEVGVRVVTAHLTLIFVIVAILLIEVLGESMLTLLVVMALFAAMIGLVGALEAIYRAALYVFASEGVVPAMFDGPALDEIWQVKREPTPTPPTDPTPTPTTDPTPDSTPT